MAERLLITAMGKDRPGILTQLTHLVGECGGSIHDSRQAVMGDDFTLIMLIEGERTAISRIEHRLPPLAMQLELLTMMKRASATPHQRAPIAAQLSLSGPDRPGITADIADFLAPRAINVHTLQSATEAANGSNMDTAAQERFSLSMALQVAEGEARFDWQAFEGDLARLCSQWGLDWQLDIHQEQA